MSFLKDCAKVSLRDQISLGLDGLKVRLATPGSFKVPEDAVVRLEGALLDLLDSGVGGSVALQDLGAFWQFIEGGATVEDAGRKVLALLPDDPAASAKKMLAGDAGEETADGTRSAVTVGLAGAVAKLGGKLPPGVRALVVKQQGHLPGSMAELEAKGLGLLNSADMVAKVQRLVGDSASILGSVEAMREDTRIQAAMATLGSKEMEDKLMAGIETIDVGGLVNDAELALTDQGARQRLVDGMKDALLEFLLQYLPSMPIPPIDGEEDGLECVFRAQNTLSCLVLDVCCSDVPLLCQQVFGLQP